MRTAGVQALVREVLESLPRPYTEHVIEDVFHAIEHQAEWRGLYDAECEDLGAHTVNSWVGRCIATELGRTGETQVPSRRCSLIESYALLDAELERPNEEQARRLVFDYYVPNKEELPPWIRDKRETIVQRVMEGMTVAEAFADVVRAGP